MIPLALHRGGASPRTPMPPRSIVLVAPAGPEQRVTPVRQDSGVHLVQVVGWITRPVIDVDGS